MSGIYIHIPFCERFCNYCSFFSTKGLKDKDRFLQAIIKEISLKSACNLINKECRTLYIGGGTPSYFGAEGIGQIVEALNKHFNLSALEEFTVELNPNDVSPVLARDFKTMGVNRISMGVQSFFDKHLVWMNRRHSSAEAFAAYDILRGAGFSNISIDLIFGFGLLSSNEWEENLKTVVMLSPEHISAYQMSIEPGSKLGIMYKRGEYEPSSDEICANEYAKLMDALSKAGYLQYEVSNFAKSKALVSKHNSSYWSGVSYLGFGPGAHSFYGGTRSWNKPVLKKYCDYYLEQQSEYFSKDRCVDNIVTGFEVLSQKDIFNEKIMLGLRTCNGVDVRELEKFYSSLFNSIKYNLNALLLSGKLASNQNFIFIPRDKFFISDAIIRELFVSSN